MNVVAADMIGDTTIETAEIIIVESTLSTIGTVRLIRTSTIETSTT